MKKYNKTVDLNFTKFSEKDFIDNPNKYFFYDSFIGITFLIHLMIFLVL